MNMIQVSMSPRVDYVSVLFAVTSLGCQGLRMHLAGIAATAIARGGDLGVATRIGAAADGLGIVGITLILIVFARVLVYRRERAQSVGAFLSAVAVIAALISV